CTETAPHTQETPAPDAPAEGQQASNERRSPSAAADASCAESGSAKPTATSPAARRTRRAPPEPSAAEADLLPGFQAAVTTPPAGRPLLAQRERHAVAATGQHLRRDEAPDADLDTTVCKSTDRLPLLPLSLPRPDRSRATHLAMRGRI